MRVNRAVQIVANDQKDTDEIVAVADAIEYVLTTMAATSSVMSRHTAYLEEIDTYELNEAARAARAEQYEREQVERLTAKYGALDTTAASVSARTTQPSALRGAAPAWR